MPQKYIHIEIFVVYLINLTILCKPKFLTKLKIVPSDNKNIVLVHICEMLILKKLTSVPSLHAFSKKLCFSNNLFNYCLFYDNIYICGKFIKSTYIYVCIHIFNFVFICLCLQSYCYVFIHQSVSIFVSHTLLH